MEEDPSSSSTTVSPRKTASFADDGETLDHGELIVGYTGAVSVGDTESLVPQSVEDVARQVEFQVYATRWYILALFSLLGLLQGMVWNTFGPISDAVLTLYCPEWNNATLALYGNWGNIMYVIPVIPVMWYFESRGLRSAMILTGGLMTVGTLIRCLPFKIEAFTWMCHICAIFNGISGIVVFAASSALSVTWFPPNERTTATALAIVFNNVGNAVAFVLGPAIVPDPAHNSSISSSFLEEHALFTRGSLYPGSFVASAAAASPAFDNSTCKNITSTERHLVENRVSILMYTEFALVATCFLAILAYFPSKPKRPPSLTSFIDRMDFVPAVKKLCSNRNALLMTVCFSLFNGLVASWYSVMVITFNKLPLGDDKDKTVGYIGMWSVFGNSVSAIIASRIIDSIKGKMKSTLLGIMFLSAICWLWLGLICLQIIPFSLPCRYDDAEWSDCEPFELIRYRVLHLLHGGRQCEEVKNISKHCTPEEFPPGVKWLIAEHRTCIAELKRLKAMIADLSKFIEALHEKGRSLLNAYLALKKHLDDLRSQISMLKGENDQQKGTLANLRAQIEEWKARARDLQTELDELKTKYHDLQVEHKEMGEKLKESRADRSRCLEGNDRLRRKIHELEMENSELKRRLLDAEKYKDQLREAKYTIGKLEYKVEKLQDQLEQVKDRLAQCKLDLLNANSYKETQYNKDTHVDLAMDMWITHNKSKVVYSTVKYTYPTTVAPKVYHVAKCLITYYGYTNETCWYQTKGDASEAGYAGMLGQHLVEAHWKYFTIDVKDAYECDKAAHLHYEFLLNRCSPKHYLPVISIFRPDENAKELTTHIYPKPNVPQPGQPNRCWVTFLGAHGQCEAHMDKYPLYNSDDTPDGYKRGSSSSKNICLSRRDNWQSFCKTPVIVTYLPDGLSTSWDDGNIMHDSHGGRMFEDVSDTSNKINPESINPHDQSVRRIYNRKSPDEYEDTPEYRKSLNMKGTDREGILMQLRRRLGITNPKYDKVDINANPRVAWHGGRVDIIKANGAPPPPVNVGNGKDAEYHAPPPAQLNPYTGMKPPQ